jgi:hypothetical protein
MGWKFATVVAAWVAFCRIEHYVELNRLLFVSSVIMSRASITVVVCTQGMVAYRPERGRWEVYMQTPNL